MHAFRVVWERMSPDSVRDGIFGFDSEADVASAQFISRLLIRQPLSTRNAARLGLAFHYVYGGVLGAAYAVVRARAPRIAKPSGIPAAFVLWLAADEIPITLSGISNPADKNLASHVSAFAAHLLYATAVENIVSCW